MSVEATLVGGAVSAIIRSLVDRHDAETDTLPKKLVEVFSAASGESAKDRTESYFASDSRQAVIESALRSALSEVEREFPDIARGGLDWSFLEREAAAELAKALIVGERPDGYAIAECLADSWVSPSRARGNAEARRQRHRMVSEALDACDRLVKLFVDRLDRHPALAELTGQDHIAVARLNSETMVRAAGRARATSAVEHRYLGRVSEEHRWLTTAGMANWTHHAQIPLDDVWISLSAVEQRTPGDESDRFLAEAEAELADRFEAGELDAMDYDAELDRLLAAFGYLSRDRQAKTPEQLAALQLVARHDRLVVLGDPGAGKSTLLHFLALGSARGLIDGSTRIQDSSGAEAPIRFPIFAKLGDLVRGPDWKVESLVDFMVRDHTGARNYPFDELTDLFSRHLERGDCIVLLDALDEIPSADDRRDVRNAVSSFVETWAPKGNQFVVTSRPAGYRAAMLSGFDHFRVQDMDRGQAKSFLNQYCTAIQLATKPGTKTAVSDGRRSATEIIEAINSSRGIARLSANPLLLSILVLVHSTGSQIPDRRAEVYHHATEALEGAWRFAQGVPKTEIPKPALLQRVLLCLADWLHAKPTGTAKYGEIKDELSTLWAAEHHLAQGPDGLWTAELDASLDKFIDGVCEQTGLLVEKAPGRYGFFHQTFQEFYVAQNLLNHRDDPAVSIRRRLHDPRYEEPILLALGLETYQRPIRARDLFDRAILAKGGDQKESEFESLLHRDRNFAYKAAGDDVELNPETVAALASRPFACPPECLANLSGTVLGQQLAANLQKLADDLTSGPETRLDLLAPIVELQGYTTEVQNVLCVIATAEAGSRHSQVNALKMLGSVPSLEPASLAAIRSVAGEVDRDSSVRSQAILVLGKSDSDSAGCLELLRSISQDGASVAEVRLKAMGVLGKLEDGSRETIELFRSIAEEASAPESLRQKSVELLANSSSDPSGLVELSHTISYDVDAPMDLRLAVLKILKRTSSQEAGSIEVLLGIIANDRLDPQVRLSAVRTISEIEDCPDIQLFEILRVIVANRKADTSLRTVAIETVGRLAGLGSQVIETLLPIATDPEVDYGLRLAACRVADRGGADDLSRKMLQAIVADVSLSPADRTRAIGDLQPVDVRHAPMLIDLRRVALDASSPVLVRLSALQKLALTGAEKAEAIGVARTILTGPVVDRRLRQQAIELVVDGFQSNAAEYYRRKDEVVLSEHASDRVAVPGKSEEAFGLLRALAAATEDPTVQRRAVDLLGASGDTSPETLQALRSVAGDANCYHPVRSASIAALAQLDDRSTQTLALLQSIASDSSVEVTIRLRIISVLGDVGEGEVGAIEALAYCAADRSIYGFVRIRAIEMLVRLGEKSRALQATRVVAKDEVLPLDARVKALDQLVMLGENALAAKMLRALIEGAGLELGLRQELIGRLGGTEDTSPETLDLLLAIADGRGETDETRLSAARALILVGDVRAAIVVLRTIGARVSTDGLRRSVVRLLRRSGDAGPATLQILHAFASDRSAAPDLRFLAAEAWIEAQADVRL